MNRNAALLRRTTLAAVLVSLLVIPAVSSAGTAARVGHGELRVTTSPTVPSRISVGGVVRNTSGVIGLELPVGTHRLCFRAVSGYVGPPCEEVVISEGAVTAVTGTFQPAGTLAVTTEPVGVGGAVVIDGVERDVAPLRLPIAAGTREVCFSDVAGWQTPACRTVRIDAGSEVSVVGAYAAASEDPPASSPPVVEPPPSSPPPAAPTPNDPAPSPSQRTSPPGRPGTVSATHGDRRAVVTWTAPSTGGSAVTGYRLTASPGGRQIDVAADTMSATLTGLSNGVRYRVSVRALSGSVTGSARESNVVVPKPAPPAHGFTDIGPGAYFDEAVRWLRAEGITQGVGGARTFAAQQDVTRAQMAAFLWRLHDTPGGRPRHGFADVAASSDFESAVRWLRAEGITAGTGRAGDRFAPNEPVTRAQMAAFLWRSAGSPQVVRAHSFRDVPADAYYAPALRWLVAHEITTGRGNAWTFAPSDHVTRAQMAAFLHRMASDPAVWEHVSPIPTTVAF